MASACGVAKGPASKHEPESESEPPSPDAGSATPAAPVWVPPEGVKQCDEGRNRRCLHEDADGDGLSVAQGDCDDSDASVQRTSECVPFTVDPPPGNCHEGPYCDRDGDGLSPALGDCNDSEANVYPGAREVCDNGVDEDCDGFDVPCSTLDEDGDGLSEADGDCDDSSPLASPLGVEICGDGIDNDCEGGDLPCDEADRDGDGFTPDEGDCNDERPDINPSALELCGDDVDNNCDGEADDDCSVPIATPIGLTLSSDEALSVSLQVALPDPRAGEIGGDILFLVDLTQSYADDVNMYRRVASDIVTQLSSAFSDLRIGLTSFRDAPCDGINSGGLPYELYLALTSDLSRFETALDELETEGNASTEEAALEGMYQALTGEGAITHDAQGCRPEVDIPPTNPAWKTGRIPLLIVGTDAPFHRPGDENFPYTSSVQDVIDAATASRTSIFFMSSGESDPDEATIAEATGGATFSLASNSDGIVLAVGEALDAALSDVTVDLVPEGPGSEFVESIAPDRIDGVNLLVDDSVKFVVTFKRALPPKTYDRIIKFDLVVRAAGGEVERIPVSITIPGVDV